MDSNFKGTATNALKNKAHTWIRILTISSVKCWFVTLMVSGHLISSTVNQYYNVKPLASDPFSLQDTPSSEDFKN
ncbi:hypothetical protein Bca4012_009877 [Brassica carinata]